MAEQIAMQPALYTIGKEGPPSLNGGRCRKCGYVFFPPQQFGCEFCGAQPEQLETVMLAGRGKLHSFATVHLHQSKGIEAPFTVGVILLDDGPAIRSILTSRTGEGLQAGDRMSATTVRQGVDEQGREVMELRFEKSPSR
jgi:uncharacterized OB-fold protein